MDKYVTVKKSLLDNAEKVIAKLSDENLQLKTERDELHLDINGLIGDTKQLLKSYNDLREGYDLLVIASVTVTDAANELITILKK